MMQIYDLSQFPDREKVVDKKVVLYSDVAALEQAVREKDEKIAAIQKSHAETESETIAKLRDELDRERVRPAAYEDKESEAYKREIHDL